MGSLSFPRERHIRRQSDFQNVYRRGSKRHARNFVILRTANRMPHSRLGISVSRKVGRAHKRNRIKRLIREAFRLYGDRWSSDGSDIVVIVKHRASPRSLGEVAGEITEALNRERRRR